MQILSYNHQSVNLRGLKEISNILHLLKNEYTFMPKIYDLQYEKDEKLETTTLSIIMECGVENLRSFCDFLHKNQLQCNEDEVKYICNQLLEQVCKLHACNLYHRDITPQNIIITKDWKFKILGSQKSVKNV